jgi:choline dehydrogenase-like flavoprotein
MSDATRRSFMARLAGGLAALPGLSCVSASTRQPPTPSPQSPDLTGVAARDATLTGFVGLQLEALQKALGGTGGSIDDPAEVARDVTDHFDRLPPLVADGCRGSLDSIDLAARLQYQQGFASLDRDRQRKVIDSLSTTLAAATVTLLSRVTWLVIHSRPQPRAAIGFTTPPNLPNPVSVPSRAPAPLDHEYEVCVIGSGAGGSVVAAVLAEHGRDVIILEEGKWVDPKDYPIRDDKALADLYRDAGVQPAWPTLFLRPPGLSFLSVLQGCVVGGGPAVNNAIHLPIERPTWDAWSTQWDFPVEWDALSGALQRVSDDLQVAPILPRTKLGDRSLRLAAGENALGLAVEDLPLSVHDCRQCGACNLGCRFGRKTGGLHGRLPTDDPNRTPRSYLMRAIDAPKPARIRPQMRVLAFNNAGDGRADAAACMDLTSGAVRQVRAKKFVLAAGALASSRLLRASGVEAGRQFSANVITSVFGLFPEPFASGPRNPGIQMCLWVRGSGHLLESWFHYPGSLAAVLPGWLNEHAKVMAGYTRLAGCGVVVPTANAGKLGGDFGPGDLVFGLSIPEFQRACDGILQLADVFKAAGAIEIYPSTLNPFVFKAATLEADKAAFRSRIQTPADLVLGTAHLQGGNPMARTRERGVIDARFRPFDLPENLFVADASLFPAGVERNPQMTVMALAHLAAGEVLNSL